MKTVPTLSSMLLFCLFVSATLVTGRDDFNNGASNDLVVRAETPPACALSCLADLAPLYGCNVTDSDCTCSNANLTVAAGACIGANCTVREALTTQRITANTCGYPVRDRGQNSRVIVWTLFAISIAFIALRFLARTKRFDGPGFGWDDYTMIIVFVFLCPHEIGAEIMVRHGLGKDIWMIEPLDNLTTMGVFFWTGEMWYSFVVTFTKISILLLYLRIFTKTVKSRWFRPTVWTFIGICVAFNTAFVLSVIFECKPVAGAFRRWDGVYEAKCFNTTAQIIAAAVGNIILDLIVFFLPLPKLMKLEISTRKKVGVCVTFLAGLFVTVVSIIRLVKFIQHYDTANMSWDFVPIANWSQFEVNVGIWCACMPALARLIKKFWVDVLGHKLSTYFSGGGHTTGPTSFVKSRVSHRSRVGSGSEVELRNDVEAMPQHGVAKTVESKVVFNRRIDSSDEVELMDKESVNSQSAINHQHQYIRDWR